LPGPFRTKVPVNHSGNDPSSETGSSTYSFVKVRRPIAWPAVMLLPNFASDLRPAVPQESACNHLPVSSCEQPQTWLVTVDDEMDKRSIPAM
jgi:hypothetical protein